MILHIAMLFTFSITHQTIPLIRQSHLFLNRGRHKEVWLDKITSSQEPIERGIE